MFVATSKTSSPPKVDLQLDDCSVSMEVDTGASISLISETTYKKLWPKRTLSASEVKLCTYSQEPITVWGCCNINIEYKDQTDKEMPLLVEWTQSPG